MVILNSNKIAYITKYSEIAVRLDFAIKKLCKKKFCIVCLTVLCNLECERNKNKKNFLSEIFLLEIVIIK